VLRAEQRSANNMSTRGRICVCVIHVVLGSVISACFSRQGTAGANLGVFKCPSREIGLDDPSPLGVSSTELLHKVARSRSLTLARGDGSAFLGVPAATDSGGEVAVSVRPVDPRVTVSTCPGRRPSVAISVRVALRFRNARPVQFDGSLTTDSRDWVAVSGTGVVGDRRASFGLWLTEGDADLIAQSPVPARWTTLCTEDGDAIAQRVWNSTLNNALSQVKVETWDCVRHHGAESRAIAIEPPSVHLSELGVSGCRHRGDAENVDVPIRIVFAPSSAWLGATFAGQVTLDSVRRRATMGAVASLQPSNVLSPLLGCQQSPLPASLDFRATMHQGVTHVEVRLTSPCEDSWIQCVAPARAVESVRGTVGTEVAASDARFYP
jgi:hypothetical protein